VEACGKVYTRNSTNSEPIIDMPVEVVMVTMGREIMAAVVVVLIENMEMIPLLDHLPPPTLRYPLKRTP